MTPSPHKPEKIDCTVEEEPGRIVIRRRSRFDGGGCFLSLWLTGWTVGCVTLAGLVIKSPNVFNIIFALPFWASWFFVAYQLVKTCFQIEILVVNAEGVDYTRKVLAVIEKRLVPLRELRAFGVYTTVTDQESGSTSRGLEITTAGRPLRCLEGLRDEELQWLKAALVNQIAGGMAGAATDEAIARKFIEVHSNFGPNDSPMPSEITLVAGEAPPEPKDAQWSREDLLHDVSFVQRGRFRLSAVLGLLFINTFWNGIVSVFVMLLWGYVPPGQGASVQGVPVMGSIEWWLMFVFLIPFEVIGLVLLVGLLAILAEPVRRTSWRFGYDQIDRQHSWFGFALWSRRWRVEKLRRIELSKTPNRAPPSPTIGGEFRLIFIDCQKREVCTLGGLTEAEAQWIGGTVLRERTEWFR